MKAIWILQVILQTIHGRILFQDLSTPYEELFQSGEGCEKGSSLSNYSSLVSVRNPLDEQQPNQLVLCGGVVISRTQILTSAGCIYALENNRTDFFFDNPNNQTVDGEFLVAISPFCTYGDGAQILQVKRYDCMYDEYIGYSNKDGSALCILNLETSLNDPTLQLPLLRTKPIYIGSVITMVGHGAISNQQDYNNIANSPKIIKFIRISDNACTQLLADLQFDKVLIKKQESCGLVQQKEGGVGICDGDEGNPIYDSEGNIAGIVTWWPPQFCNNNTDQNLPIVFADVDKKPIHNFLQSNVNQKACKDGEVFSEAPWIVSIQKISASDPTQFENFCTGVLIDDAKILTVAQCIWDTTQNWDIRNPNITNKSYGYFNNKFFASLAPRCQNLNGIYPRKQLKKWFVNSNYNGDPSYGFNQAIIEVQENFPAEECFPDFESSMRKMQKLKGIRGFSDFRFYKWGPGPGRYEESNGSRFALNYGAQEVAMQIQKLSTCSESVQSNVQNIICASQPSSANAVNICGSDKGGPLIAKPNNSDKIVILGLKQELQPGKCYPNYYDVSAYTNIIVANKFILSTLHNEQYLQPSAQNIITPVQSEKNDNDDDNKIKHIIIIINSIIGGIILLILLIGLIIWRKLQKTRQLQIICQKSQNDDSARQQFQDGAASNASESIFTLDKNTQIIHQMLVNYSLKSKNSTTGKVRRHSDLYGALEFLILKHQFQFQNSNFQKMSMDDSFLSLSEGLLPFCSFRPASVKYNKQGFYEDTDSVQKQSYEWFNLMEMGTEVSKSDFGLILMDTPVREDFDLQIDYEKELKMGERLGSGVFGSVYKALWTTKNMYVAVKVMHSNLLDQLMYDEQQRSSFLNSFKLELDLLSRIDSPHIVKCYGGCLKPPKICLVLEYVPNRSLDRFIYSYHGQIPIPFIMRIAQGIAEGLDALHPTIVHRDLKPQNVLLDYNYSVKLADFGLSKMKESSYLSGAAVKGTAAYASPEIFLGESIDEKCDIYALGMIMWEMISKERPWEELNLPVVVMARVAIKQQRPTIPQNCPNELKRLIEHCWAQNPRERPSAREVVQKLTILRKIVSNKSGSSSQDQMQQELQDIQESTLDCDDELGLDFTYSKFTIQSSASSIIF